MSTHPHSSTPSTTHAATPAWETWRGLAPWDAWGLAPYAYDSRTVEDHVRELLETFRAARLRRDGAFFFFGA